MSNTLAHQIDYARSQNGTDVYVLKTPTKDVVTCMMAFEGAGTYASYSAQSVVSVFADLLPSGTTTRKKKEVLDVFESLGAKVTISHSGAHLLVTLASQQVYFLEAFELLLEVLTDFVMTQDEFKASWSRIKTMYQHAKEDTRTQALLALRQAMYLKGHPHWLPSTKKSLQEIEAVTKNEVHTFHKNTFSSIGSLVCVVGDVQPKKIMQSLQTLVETLPVRPPFAVPKLHIERTNMTASKEDVVTIKNKFNVDTFVGIPLGITRDDTDFQALQVGVSILGASSSSRLFATLRTKRNLTYGSYATLDSFSTGYPGYLSALAIFPNDVYERGRPILEETIQTFVEKGVRPKELEEHKEELMGKFNISLSTTVGMCSVLFGVLLNGKPVSYIDEYADNISALSSQRLNNVIKKHVDFSLAKTRAAGAITKEGTPV
ncbi:MAG: Peptidase family M16 domain protein [Parcubacteria group bacterium GW2011_GWA2_43_11]|nr:MAG: Peptidase family M16 domain protein [Parcubacteria group bacterium GW2011_GWC2_42_11]KKS84707.1 MAG: Peptidase family M16 domain protein [Parcubacteria group bacterium GW2011_GWA2_43_11]